MDKVQYELLYNFSIKKMKDTIKIFMEYRDCQKVSSFSNPYYYIQYQRLVNDTVGEQNKLHVINLICDRLMYYMSEKVAYKDILKLIKKDIYEDHMKEKIVHENNSGQINVSTGNGTINSQQTIVNERGIK